jgi:phospholipid/cholesterol/gamma-HCH transport system permease protein
LTAQPKSITEEAKPRFRLEREHAGSSLHFGGAWKAIRLENLENSLKDCVKNKVPQQNTFKICLEKDFTVDTAGACLISNMIKALKNKKITVDDKELETNSHLRRFLEVKPAGKPEKDTNTQKRNLLDALGYRTCNHGKKIVNILAFLGEILVIWMKTVCSFRKASSYKLRWVSVFRQAEEIGVRALPIIGLISFLIGMVLAYQSINQLSRFGAQLYTVDFLGVGLLREIAVLITAIVIAGRSGSAFTAQIGSMALNQEIDAIRMLGLDPILILVIPRILAIVVCLPLLVFFAMIMGLAGGMVMVSLTIDLSPFQFVNQLHKAITLSTFWVGMSKSPLFAIVIGLVGCYRGFQVKGSAESVGRQTTQSVVESIFMVIVLDAFMSILFSYLKV